ncbi:hypothetical protein PHYSODRAFT_308265 [Phytophthora sojae]|uniref:Uncharacterized protein n=1 Tax=Phytophthora sojae (strain P6497) TaxID=1094619 RepID=G5AJA6_PHYSP|nr:hypothetical protein PHYSODRAFT_308265 [Phytophthora sojae]EGZ04399.1 hypothetical protein PHYSODRAFT_308265 [Phytophthora sojae]|eukprot:XP_009540157.1 hypothetical protein PHYSODRAFT_308265 [Phytophthora sojae]
MMLPLAPAYVSNLPLRGLWQVVGHSVRIPRRQFGDAAQAMFDSTSTITTLVFHRRSRRGRRRCSGYTTYLAGVAINDVQVFNGSDGPLKAKSLIDSLGQTMEEALVVTVLRTRGREETKDEADESPAKRHRTAGVTEWVWRKEEPVYSVQDGIMAFVNREHAALQLQEFHANNYNRANIGLGGENWVVPLVDTVFGIGKTRFGAEYIRRCQQMWAAHPNRGKDSFLDTLTQCHTIQIQFSRTDLLDSELKGREETKDEADESPAKRHRTAGVTEWVWRKEEPVYSVQDGIMAFVNREHATLQLQEFHANNYNRANIGLGGENWVVPLVDTVFGIGKTRFGAEYIRRCQQMWAAHPNRGKDSFLDTLTQCHTIQIQFSRTDLLDSELKFNSDMADAAFVEQISYFFEEKYDRLPGALTPQSLQTNSGLVSVFKRLTKEVGPLFIVIDEIGAAFDAVKLDPLAVVSQQEVIFLDCCRATFLSYVGLRPTACVEMTNSPVDFQRLSLNLLRSPAIEEIIKTTYWDKGKTETIQQHFNLSDGEVKKSADHLFKTTFGHPRSLLRAFKVCQSVEELNSYDAPFQLVERTNWQRFGERLRNFKEPLRFLMTALLADEAVDLGQRWRDQGGKEITYDAIVDMFGIAWEGESKTARLHIPQHIQHAALSSFYPFRELLERAAPALGRVAIDHPDEFELLCMTRFQEVFDEEKRPSDVLSEFFADTSFGRTKVKFAKITYEMPQVTSKGKKQSSLTEATAHPGDLKALLMEIHGLALENGQLSLKPLPKSSSPDILLMTTSSGTMVTVGLAVKNYAKSSKVGGETIREECKKFSKVCLQLPKSSLPRLNVLILCATAYTFHNETFQGAKFAVYSTEDSKDDRAGIDEVILLDLSTRGNRGEFFGIAGIDELERTLEAVVVAKPSVDVVQTANQ